MFDARRLLIDRQNPGKKVASSSQIPRIPGPEGEVVPYSHCFWMFRARYSLADRQQRV